MIRGDTTRVLCNKESQVWHSLLSAPPFSVFRSSETGSRVPHLEMPVTSVTLRRCIPCESLIFQLFREDPSIPWHCRVNTTLNKVLSLWWMCSRYTQVYGDCQPRKCATPADNGIWCVIWPGGAGSKQMLNDKSKVSCTVSWENNQKIKVKEVFLVCQ